MAMSNEEVNAYNRRASERAREGTLGSHLKEVLTPPEPETEAGGEEEEIEEDDDFRRYEIRVPNPVAERDKRFDWSETKKALPCPDEIEAALCFVLKLISDPDSKMTPLQRAEALTGMLKFSSTILVATIKARA
ncbi:MAG: hypothetical protein AAB074_12980 [Planctomycetota bacterium]